MSFAERRGLVEVLAGVPRAPLGARLELEVAAGHVETDGIGADAVECPVGRNAEGRRADQRHQLDLVVIVFRARRIGDLAAADHRRLGPFGEEEWRIAGRILAHLARMGLVVAPDAEDAAQPDILCAFDREQGQKFGKEWISHK
ncbi:hypothetical protein D3C80_1619150 [compost metagenome]